jgi:hypothetical protein
MNELDTILSTDNVHKTYHHFCNYMKRWYYKNRYGFSFKTLKETKKVIREFDPTKMLGYSAMLKVKYYEKKYGGIKTVTVDDDSFMGSIIVLIPHPKMGITSIYIPQCGYNINTFFLYPGHFNQLTKIINEMKKEYELK